MRPREDLKMYTLRHSLFYIGVAAAAGAVVGFLAGTMDWSNGLIYGIGLPTCAVIGILALREGLFGPTARSNQRQHQSHT